MGKPTGFLEYERKLPPSRDPLERIRDWKEFVLDFAGEKLAEQGARCMNCGIPYCHTGMIYAGAAMGCPINNLIPEWNDLVYRGLWREAYFRLRKTNNFPEFTGRVCPAPCEGSCTVSLHQKAVTIKNIERSIIERAFAEGRVQPRIPAKRSGKKVAVVGSGPSGLACADELNQAGHMVTVFEKADRPGGLLMYGIPNMKLDKRIVFRRVDLLQREGITFATNTEVGRDLPAETLIRDYDAAVLCGGARNPRDLKAEGRELRGITFAVDFLSQNTRSLLDSDRKDGKFISARDKDVVVVGGGDTGTDCVATSIRHGCRSLVQLEIMPKPPEMRKPDNPWLQWPRIYSMDYGQQEAAALFGEDPRKYCVSTKRFLGDSQGHVKALEIVDIEWEREETGRFISKEIPGSRRVLPAQLVLLAMGFLGPAGTLPEQLGVERDGHSNIKTADKSYATNGKGIFTAGDMHRGQSLVVWAIDEGRRAARECDAYLRENA